MYVPAGFAIAVQISPIFIPPFDRWSVFLISLFIISSTTSTSLRLVPLPAINNVWNVGRCRIAQQMIKLCFIFKTVGDWRRARRVETLKITSDYMLLVSHYINSWNVSYAMLLPASSVRQWQNLKNFRLAAEHRWNQVLKAAKHKFDDHH